MKMMTVVSCSFSSVVLGSFCSSGTLTHHIHTIGDDDDNAETPDFQPHNNENDDDGDGDDNGEFFIMLLNQFVFEFALTDTLIMQLPATTFQIPITILGRLTTTILMTTILQNTIQL